MKIDRLLAITIYLLNHGKTSAQFLAQHFEVSTRTIIRDMDTLSLAGIPVVSTYGAEGGYEIMDTFKMQQQVAGEVDYQYVVCALQALASAYTNKDMEKTLEKMQSLTSNKPHTMVMDLSVVHENRDTNQMLFILNQYIQNRQAIRFLYTNSSDAIKEVEVEPVATLYKWYNWYMIGYSLSHDNYRMYKVIRMEEIKTSEKASYKEHNLQEVSRILEDTTDVRKKITVVLQCNKQFKSKCREYLNGQIIKEYDNGDFEYQMTVPEDETFWYGMILSFGQGVKVIAPTQLIERIKKDCTDIIQWYNIEGKD